MLDLVQSWRLMGNWCLRIVARYQYECLQLYSFCDTSVLQGLCCTTNRSSVCIQVRAWTFRSLCTKTKRNMVWPWCWEFWTVLRYSENLEGGILCWKVSAAISWMMLHDIPFRWSPVYMLTPDLPWVWRQRKRQRTRPTDWEHLFLVSKMAFSPNIFCGMQSVSFHASYSWYHLYLRYVYLKMYYTIWYLISLYT